MRARFASLLVLLLAALASACSPPFDEVWQLKDFRVLGVTTNPPEVVRGGTVQLSLVTADPKNRAVDAVWIGCSKPFDLAALAASSTSGSGTGGSSLIGCSMRDLLVQLNSTTATFTIPTTGGTANTRNREVLSVFGFACAGGRIDVGRWIVMLSSAGSSALTSGLPTPPCTGNDTYVWAFTKSIYVRDPSSAYATANPPNQNPVISAVRLGPADGDLTPMDPASPPTLAACAKSEDPNAGDLASQCTRMRFDVQFADGSRQPYFDLDSSTQMFTVSKQERLTVGFVVDGGKLSGGFRTDSDAFPLADMANDYFAPPASGDHRLFVYVIDGRGGFAWTQRTFRVP